MSASNAKGSRMSMNSYVSVPIPSIACGRVTNFSWIPTPRLTGCSLAGRLRVRNRHVL